MAGGEVAVVVAGELVDKGVIDVLVPAGVAHHVRVEVLGTDRRRVGHLELAERRQLDNEELQARAELTERTLESVKVGD